MSLRLRLLLAVGAVAVLALVAADVATYQALRSFLYTRVDQSLEAAHFPIEGALLHRRGPGEVRVAIPIGTSVGYRDTFGNTQWDYPSYRRDGTPTTPKLPTQITLPAQQNGPGEPAAYLTVGAAQPHAGRFRVRVSSLPDGTQLLLGVPLDDTVSTLRHLLNIELAVTGLALLVAAGLGWWLVRLGLRPLADMERTAEVIAGGKLDQRIAGANNSSEVGRLAGTLNTMLGRIQDAFAARDATEAELRRSEERLRRFVADASHELRTPLAAVSAYAELFERGAREHPDDLDRVMSGIRVETGRMGRLVEDLLLLARIDEGRPLAREPVELVSLVAEAIETARAVGPEWPVRLEADRPVEVVGDEARLRQVFDNLLANIRAHTPPHTTALVQVGMLPADSPGSSDQAIIAVADNGPGLSQEDADRVFERFYRADQSRSRQYGGAGLGLGIVAAIVGAHGGRVSAAPTPGGGVTFTVRLPLSGPPVAGHPEPSQPVTAQP